MAVSRIDFIELPVDATAATATFYDEAFGWQMQSFGPTYACTMNGDVDLGLQADPPERSAAVLPVIHVADLEGTLRAVEAAGGEVVRGIFAYPGGRRFHFLDPAGNELAAHTPDPA